MLVVGTTECCSIAPGTTAARTASAVLSLGQREREEREWAVAVRLGGCRGCVDLSETEQTCQTDSRRSGM